MFILPGCRCISDLTSVLLLGSTCVSCVLPGCICLSYWIVYVHLTHMPYWGIHIKYVIVGCTRICLTVHCVIQVLTPHCSHCHPDI